MIDIYNEVNFIKNVLRDGFSSKWMRDAKLLVRYYKLSGMSKKEAISKVKEKCEVASSKGVISYNPLINFKEVNAVVNRAWKETQPLREINQVEISREVLDWFLSLSDSYIIQSELTSALKVLRPMFSIKNNKPVNWDRTKYLFTLYIWSLIQKNYTPEDKNYDKFYFNNPKNVKRFREDANLKSSFNMDNNRNLLEDIGLLEVNFGLGITPCFISLPVFQIPVTDDNRIIITTGEPPYGDLYNPGLWLDKQKYGTFTCQHCGKTLPHYNTSPREQARKYCKECAKAIKEEKVHPEVYTANDPTHRWCIDCGNMFEVKLGDTRSIRCPKCQEEANKKSNRERQRRFQEKASEIHFLD